MSNIKISDLPIANILNESDSIPVVQYGDTKKLSGKIILDKIKDATIASNEMSKTVVELCANNSAESIRNSIPSGFVKLTDLDLTKNNNGSITLKDESIAYIHGFEIRIPKDTIINLGKAPNANPREDLVFLEAWKDNSFKVTGKLSWRIRHIEDINFNNIFDFSSTLEPYIGWTDHNIFSKVYAIGANTNILPPSNPISGIEIFRGSTVEWSNTPVINDCGLWIAGDKTSNSLNRFKTLDGYCYAIPMFRLYRKPSSGLAKPFEYQKINAQVDYKAFSERVKGDKVEKCEEIVIKGKTYQNLCKGLYKDITPVYSSIVEIPNGVDLTVASPNSALRIQFPVVLSPKLNTDYTLLFNSNSNNGNAVFYGTPSEKENGERAYYNTTSPIKRVLIRASKQTITNYIYLYLESGALLGQKFNITNLILLEGDHTNNPDVLNYFEGIKSVGEKEDNKVEIITTGDKNEPCKESRLTYQLDAPLRSLPNGVCDEIVGNKLTRRVGKVVLNGSETWGTYNILANTNAWSLVSFNIGFPVKPGSYNNSICSILKHSIGGAMSDSEGYTNGDSSTSLFVRLNKTKLADASAYAFKKWLEANPMELIYELANPIETILTECISSKTDFTLNRQFKKTEKNYLLESYDGVKDEIIDGKVHRRVGKVEYSDKHEVLFDDLGNPSVMVKIPKFKISDVIEGGSNKTHPAFIVSGIEKDFIYISKYQNIVSEGRAYSLPDQDPTTSINFDQALSCCYKKGPGWHLMSNAEYAAIALWCKKNNCMPRGNNNYGSDHSAPDEKGEVTYMLGDTPGRVATGSGPRGWSHDGTTDGIYDLNGNVWELTSGMRLKDGEIQIIQDNNVAIQNSDHGVNSVLWKSVLQDGSLVAPGTANSLKWDYLASKITLSTTNTVVDASRAHTFELLAKAAGVTTTPEILNTLGLHPTAPGLDEDNIYMNNYGERLPFRGGSFTFAAGAGVFALYLSGNRTGSDGNVGFRSAYVS